MAAKGEPEDVQVHDFSTRTWGPPLWRVRFQRE